MTLKSVNDVDVLAEYRRAVDERDNVINSLRRTLAQERADHATMVGRLNNSIAHEQRVAKQAATEYGNEIIDLKNCIAYLRSQIDGMKALLEHVSHGDKQSEQAITLIRQQLTDRV